jgi:hypothetical protein
VTTVDVTRVGGSPTGVVNAEVGSPIGVADGGGWTAVVDATGGGAELTVAVEEPDGAAGPG